MVHYWIVDTDEPSILALELEPDTGYTDVASVAGDAVFRAATPFAVEFTPAALVAD